MKPQRLAALLGIAFILSFPAKAMAKSSFFLPLRFESAGTCIGNGSTTQTIETSYGLSLATLPFTGTASYDFYSPPITTAPALAPADGAAGQLWLTNASATTDFNVTVKFVFYDYDPTTAMDIQIVDTGAGVSTKIPHLNAAQAATPITGLPGNFTATVGHLLHIKATVTLVSGVVNSASILCNAPSGVNGDSAGLLPEKHRTKIWTFAGLTSSPDATITPSSSCISAACALNTASVPSAAGAAYAWTINGGTISAGQGTHQITWNPSSAGPVMLGVTVTKTCCSTGAARVDVMPANTLALRPNAQGTVTLTLAGTPAAQYRLQAASNLRSPAWVTISTNVAGIDGLVTFTDLQAPNYPARFYRATMP